MRHLNSVLTRGLSAAACATCACALAQAQTSPSAPAPAAGAKVTAQAATKIAPMPASKTGREVAVVPPAVSAGQPITLRWLFTGTKVLLTGGRFGTKGVVVTGKSSITDTPSKTTKYTFDVFYDAPTTGPDGKPMMKPVHVTYNAIAEVVPNVAVDLTTYRDRFGWQVAFVKGWKRDNVDFPDPANNALMFFQKEDDAVERMAVSIVPAREMTAAELIDKVQRSLSANYDEVEVVSKTEVEHGGVPAMQMVFTGKDQTHPGTRTQSVFLALVRDGRGYVVSARTHADKFNIRKPVLEKMVRSFNFVASASKSASK